MAKEGLQVSTEKLDVKERDGFSARNGMTAVLNQADGSVFLFGGQDSEKDVQFEDVWRFKDNEVKQVELDPNAPCPAPRNSHSMTVVKGKAYIFGGANHDGPLADLWEFDMQNQSFKKVALSGVPLPAIEMHTAHCYQDKLLILGGRALP